MSCGRSRSALRDLALGQAASPALDRHLASCESCRRQIEGDRRLAARIDRETEEALAVEVSPELVARVRIRIAEPETTTPWLHWWGRLALAAAALGIVAFLAGRAPGPSPSLAPPPDSSGAQAGIARGESAGGGSVSPRRAELKVAPLVSPPVSLVGPASPSAGPPRRQGAASRAPVAPERIAPEVLIPSGDREATRRFLAGRHRWRLLQGTPLAREVETLESPAVVDWELESRRAQGFTARALESWPLMPSD